MDFSTVTESLLYNEAFLRSVLVVPLLGVGYVFLVVYKQYRDKFKHKSLVASKPHHGADD